MIDVRHRDRGPFVAALQVLLNQYYQATRIVVDGIWGSETQAAMADLNRSIQARGGGDRADGATWAALSRDGRASVISSNDIYDSRHDQLTPPDLRGPGWIATSGMSGGVGQVARDIQTRARALGPIALLRFFGHGAPGLMGITGGTGTMRGSAGDTLWRDEDSGAEAEAPQRPGPGWERVMGDHVRDQTTISNATFALVEPQLSRLRSNFAPFGSVQLHGCRVGLGRDGAQLLQSLADALGVPASAGRRRQSFGITTTLRFEGSVVTMYPGGGTLASWTEQFRD